MVSADSSKIEVEEEPKKKESDKKCVILLWCNNESDIIDNGKGNFNGQEQLRAKKVMFFDILLDFFYFFVRFIIVI